MLKSAIALFVLAASALFAVPASASGLGIGLGGIHLGGSGTLTGGGADCDRNAAGELRAETPDAAGAGGGA